MQNRPPGAESGAVLMTKLTPPSARPNLVPRPRISALLDRGLSQGHRLLLISAPAGSGKTTLVAGWLAERMKDEGGGVNPGGAARSDSSSFILSPLSFAWLSLDAGDNDPQRFFTYLIAALRRADPQLGAATASLLGGPALPAVEGLIIPLLNDLAAAARPILLVLDDYHLVETPVIHAAVALLLDRQPPQLRLALVTRADPSLPLPRLRAGGAITEVRAADLRFTADEIATFFRQTTPAPLDVPALETIGAHTEGWAAGLQLAGLSLHGRSAEECAAFAQRFGSSSQYVIDYLADEVLAQQPPHRKAFLLQTAILNRLCGPLCDALILGGDADSDVSHLTPAPRPPAPDSYSQHILEELERANLFLIPLDAQRRWYRYHHLFAEALRVQMDAEPGARARLHRCAAGWFAAQGAWEDGVHHATLAGDYALAGRLIGQGSADLLRRGELQTLGGWLAALPEPFVAGRSDLAVLHAWVAYATGRLDQCERRLADLVALPPERIAPHSRGRVLALQAMHANAAGSAEAIPLAMQAIALLGDDPLFCQAAMLALGNGQRLAGETGAAGDTYRAALGLGRGQQSPYIAIDLLNSLAVNLNEQGRRGAALQLCADARRDWSDAQGQQLPILDLLAVAECVLAYEGGALAEARAQADRGWDAVRRWMSARIVGLETEQVFILASAGLGDMDAAWRRIADARAIGSAMRWFAPALDVLEAILHLRQGDIAAAAGWARAAGLTPDAAPDPLREHLFLTYARVLLAEGRLGDAGQILSRIADSSARGPRMTRLISVRVLQSLVAERRGAADLAARHLAEALALAAPGGYVRRFLDEGPQVAAILRRVRADSPAPRGLIAQILTAAGAAPGPPADPRPQPIAEPLSAQELAVLHLLAEGCSNQSIAERLVITVGTAKWHAHNIYAKLGVSRRTQAVARARALGLIA